jgi:hypothetical protein
MSATHGIVLELVRNVEELGHELYLDHYFSLPALFNDLFLRKINCCGTVRNDRQGMPKDISSPAIKAKKGDIITRVRGNQSVVPCKNKRDVYN